MAIKYKQMKLEKELLEKTFRLYDFPIEQERMKVTNKTIKFFEDIGLSGEVINFFKDFSFKYSFDFEGNRFLNVNKIRSENLKEVNKEIYKYNLLIIGSAMNGDPIVLNIKTLSVGYVFHDKLWECEKIENLKRIYIDMNISIGEFFFRSATDDDFPIDAYEAEDFIND